MQGFMVCTDSHMLRKSSNTGQYGESLWQEWGKTNVFWLLMGKPDEKGPHKTCE